ncbi:MAG: hypothetical protein AAGP08_05215 [Pseudomonadota bacterium]
MTRQVFAFRGDRTISRLKNLLSAMDFCESIDAELTLYWYNYDKWTDVDLKFYDIFDEEKMAAQHPNLKLAFTSDDEFYDIIKPEEFGPERSLTPTELTHVAIRLTKQPSYSVEQFRELAFDRFWYDSTGNYPFADRLGDPRLDEKRVLFDSLPLHGKILAALDEVKSGFDLNNAIGVHIRRGDVLSGPWGVMHAGVDVEGKAKKYHIKSASRSFIARHAHVNCYHRAIADLPSDKKVIIFSDDVSVRDEFEERYADRFVDIHKILDRMDLVSAQRDFAEFLVMKEVNEVIATDSAYAQFALALGRGKSNWIQQYIYAEDAMATMVEVLKERPDRDYAAIVVRRAYVEYLRKVHRPEEADKLEEASLDTLFDGV